MGATTDVRPPAPPADCLVPGAGGRGRRAGRVTRTRRSPAHRHEGGGTAMGVFDRVPGRGSPRRFRLAALAALVSLLAVAGDAAAATASRPAVGPPAAITEFPLPAGSRPHGLTAGPDGALWFV